MKIKDYIYGAIWIFVTPPIIGGGVSDFFERVYHNFDGHILAMAAICAFSGLVVAWMPMASIFIL